MCQSRTAKVHTKIFPEIWFVTRSICCLLSLCPLGFAEEMAKWKKMTAGMGVLTVLVTAYVVATEEHHHKDEDAPVVSPPLLLILRVFRTRLVYS